MGAKYLPTHKDLKASRRFHQKQIILPKFKKTSAIQPAKTGAQPDSGSSKPAGH